MVKTKSKKTVLIVEDELSLQNAIRLKLEKNDFLTISARSVGKAIECLEKNENIDIVWLDHYLLGDETGLDLVAKLKKRDEWKNIPLLIVSNTASSSKIKEYADSGVKNRYIKSNHHLEKIVNDIKEMLG